MKEYRVVYSMATFGWNVLDSYGAVAYETATRQDAESWASKH